MSTNVREEVVKLIVDGKQVTGSYNELKKSQREITKNLRGMQEGTKEYQKEAMKLNRVNAQLDKVGKNIKGVGHEWKKQTTAFKQGISSRVNGLSMYGVSVGDITSKMGFFTKSMQGSSKAAKLLRVALISTGIGALVVLLGSLITYLSSTQSGMDKITKVTRPLAVIFQRFLGIVQDLGASLFEMVSNPRKTFESFKDWIKGTFMPIFQGLGRIIEGVGITLTNVFNAEAQAKGIEQIKKGISDTGDAVSGLYQKAVNGAKAAAGAVKEFVEESVEQGTKLDTIIKKIDQAEIDLIKNKGRLNRAFQEQKTLASDTTKADEERVVAANAAEKAFMDLTTMENRLLDMKIEKMKMEQTFNDTSRADLKELAALEAQREDNMATFEKKRMSIIALRNSALNGEMKAIAAAAKSSEEEDQLKLEKLQNGYDQELLLLKQKYADQKITAQQFQDEMQVLELSGMMLRKEAMEALGMDVLDLEESIADTQIKILEDRIAQEEETSAAIIASKTASAEAFSDEAAQSIENAKTIEEAGRGLLNALRSAVKERIKVFISQAVAAQLAKVFTSVPFPLNVVAAPIAAAGAAALFEKAVPSFYYGGATGSDSLGFSDQYGPIAGMVHQNEYVVPQSQRSDPYYANTERYLEGRKKFGALGDLSSTSPSSQNIKLTNTEQLTEAGQMIMQAAVLLKSGIPAVFSRTTVEEFTDDYNEKENARSRGSLSS